MIQTETHNNNTALPLVGVLVTCFGRINNIRNKIESLRLLWDIVVYRLLRICKIRSVESYIYTFWYNFDTVLYQFLETGTSDRTLICLNQVLRRSGFSLYPLSLRFRLKEIVFYKLFIYLLILLKYCYWKLINF